MASETIVDFTHEAKVAVGALQEAAKRVNENGKSLLDAHAILLATTLELSQQTSQVYGDIFLSAIQQWFDQSMAFRNQISHMGETNYKRLFDLATSEQKLTLEAAEAYQAQTKVAAERIADLFTPLIK